MQSNLRILPAHILEISTILHVALLVFLRWKSIKRPLKEIKNEEIYRIAFVVIVWTISISACIIPVLFLAFEMFETFRYIKLVSFHCFGTIPVISIIVMWGLLMKVAKDRRMKDNHVLSTEFLSIEESNHRRMVKIVHRLVIALLICYIPFLFWKQYFYSIVLKRTPNPNYTEAVRFFFHFCQML